MVSVQYLNNLAQLLRATNGLGEAERLSRRAVEILLKFTRATGHPHPHLPATVMNYVRLLMRMGMAPPEMLQKLQTLGPEAVAILLQSGV